MKKRAAALALSVAVGLSCGGLAHAGDPATTKEAAQNAPDNSGRNVRDRDGSTLTAADQGTSKGDVALTQKIRSRVVDDDSLSVMAHNVKIITVDGVVTLRGPVKSKEEKQRIASAAEQIAGRGRVNDNLEIAQ